MVWKMRRDQFSRLTQGPLQFTVGHLTGTRLRRASEVLSRDYPHAADPRRLFVAALKYGNDEERPEIC